MRSELGRWSEMIVAGDPALADIAPAIENELLAMATLDTIHAHRLLPDEAVFIGGTALRLCYGSPRFSDDLGFHAPPNVHFESIDAEALARELGAAVGAEIAINHPTSESTSALVCISAALPERTRDGRRPQTRIDMARKRQVDAHDTIVLFKMAGGAVAGLGDLAEPCARLVSSREEILVDKHLALVGRSRRVKNRDLFDIMWLHQQGVEFQPDMLAAKLQAVRNDFADALHDRAEAGRRAIADGLYNAELERYLPAGSPWLFDQRQRQEMAGGFATLVRDNAKKVGRALAKAVVGARPPTGGQASD